MRSTSTESTSPGAAPSTNTGPVAGLMRAQSTAAGASPGARICPAKQSAVSSRTVWPVRIRATGTASAERLKTCWSCETEIMAVAEARRRAAGSIAVDLAPPGRPRRGPVHVGVLMYGGIGALPEHQKPVGVEDVEAVGLQIGEDADDADGVVARRRARRR